MLKQTITIRFMVLAEAFTRSSQPWYVLTMQGMNNNRIDQKRVHKRPEYIPTQL